MIYGVTWSQDILDIRFACRKLICDNLIAGSVLTDYASGARIFFKFLVLLAEKQITYWAIKIKRRHFPL